MVSDGYTIIKTDKSGLYKIKPDAKAEFVFISSPAGYAFPEENKLARFYQPLAAGSRFDFNLIPLKKNDDQHSFILWADPQVKNKKDVAKMMAESVPDVQQVVKEMGADELVHGICVGDIVWDAHDLFADYNNAVAKMDIPFFQTLGNHDEDYRLGGDETSDHTFKAHYGPTYYSFNRGKAHYVVMDNVRYLGKEREYDGFIVEQQLNWLEKDLKPVPKDQLLIICLHIPVHSGVKNNQDLYALLAPFKNVHIMSGHTHYQVNNITGNVYEHNHGTVCGAWWTGPICGDGTPSGYGVYHVEGSDLKWYYKATGFDKSHQIVLHTEELTNQKRITANVWNWDPNWKITYFVDGKAKGTMENQQGFDPLAVKLYLGDKLPQSGRFFVEPNKTDHLFIAHLTDQEKHIKVVATDRFGNQYEAEANV
ncbi:MAG: metallophosphoesterase [Sphingobacteriaceae bacterium]|nr:MAG: metallophosphoesterase [Sphingobacteriaceae bacterium]